MRVKMIYDQGTAAVPEDRLIAEGNYYGVVDGVSAVYHPSVGPTYYDGKTGGQLVTNLIHRSFQNADSSETAADVLLRASIVMAKFWKRNGIPLDDASLLPAAAYVAVCVRNELIEVVQGGDCLAVWKTKDGEIGLTPNLMFDYETDLHRTIACLMEKHNSDRNKMWKDFLPYMIKMRRDCVNNSEGPYRFSLLNGQPRFADHWQIFNLNQKEIDFLLLFSDGFVPMEFPQDMAKRIAKLYKNGGLPMILHVTRSMADRIKSSSHEDFPEATAIAIDF